VSTISIQLLHMKNHVTIKQMTMKDIIQSKISMVVTGSYIIHINN